MSENLTLRTWRQGTTLMAFADAALTDLAVIEAVRGARRRWPALQDVPATLLVGEYDLETARAIAGVHPDVIADIRQVEGLQGPGWAVGWPFAPEANG